MIDPAPVKDLATPMSQEAHDEVMKERDAVVKWLTDAAADCAIPTLRKLYRHEADGIKRGLHRMENS